MLNLSPVARRRFERFKKNRRGWWSLWLFIGLFILTLGGELIANDKPLVLSFKNELYFPVFKRYTEQQFGGQLPFQADYRSDYVQKLIKQDGGWMLFPPVPFSDDTPNYELTRPAPSPPSAVNWLGTDDQSRDVLARVIFGARVSILFALALTAISAAIGIAQAQGPRRLDVFKVAPAQELGAHHVHQREPGKQRHDPQQPPEIRLDKARQDDQQVQHRQPRPHLQHALADQVDPAAVVTLQRPGGDADGGADGGQGQGK